MPAKKPVPTEREYIVNLRREILKVPRYKRTPKAIKALKKFVAKHMRIAERDESKIKIDKYLNQELWFRGIKNPPTKLKIKCKKDGEDIIVTLVELPDKWKFAKEREDKKNQSSEKVKKEKVKKEEEEKPAEEKKEEEEKEKAGEEADKKLADTQAKQSKHIQSEKTKKTQPKRMALQK